MRHTAIGFFLAILLGTWACTSGDSAGTTQAVDPLGPDSARRPVTIDDQLRSLRSQLDASPENWALLEERSQLYLAKGEIDSAIFDIEKALQLNLEDPGLHYLRGMYALAAQDTSGAEYAFSLSANYGSGYGDTYYQWGRIKFFENNYAEARKLYRQAMSLDSAESLYPFALGLLEQEAGNYQRAVTYYQRAARTEPGYDKALVRLHDIYLDEFQEEETAMAYVDTLLEYEALHPLGRYYRGNSFYRQALAYRASGDTAAFQQAANDAVTEYTFSINKAGGTLADPYFFRGYLYLAGERYDLAMNDLQQAIAIDSTYAQAHFYLGSLHEYYGDPVRALEQYRLALRYDPQFTEAEEAVRELSSN